MHSRVESTRMCTHVYGNTVTDRQRCASSFLLDPADPFDRAALRN